MRILFLLFHLQFRFSRELIRSWIILYALYKTFGNFISTVMRQDYMLVEFETNLKMYTGWTNQMKSSK